MHAETVYFSKLHNASAEIFPSIFIFGSLLNSFQPTCFKKKKNALFSNPIDMEYSWDAFDVSSPSNF